MISNFLRLTIILQQQRADQCSELQGESQTIHYGKESPKRHPAASNIRGTHNDGFLDCSSVVSFFHSYFLWMKTFISERPIRLRNLPQITSLRKLKGYGALLPGSISRGQLPGERGLMTDLAACWQGISLLLHENSHLWTCKLPWWDKLTGSPRQLWVESFLVSVTGVWPGIDRHFSCLPGKVIL